VRAALALTLVVLAVVGILETRLTALHHLTTARRPVDEATIPSPGAVRLLSLGHREWAADLLWISALIYFGETLVTHQQQRFLQRYAETIQSVDPQFRQAYLWGATVSVYNARVIRRESIENAIANLQRGLRVFPDDPEMIYQLGFNYFFELPRYVDNADERAEIKRRGAEYLRRAAALGEGPPWMGLAAAEALQHTGLVDRAVAELRDLYLRTESPEIRARIEAEIQHLLGERASAVDPILEAARRMDAERRAWFPYVPPVLYMFIGPPVPGVAHGAPAPAKQAAQAPARADASAPADDATGPSTRPQGS
jgi:hypothetical protein